MNIPATINNDQAKRDHSVFEADIEGQAMNLQYLKRIAGWVKPHKQAAIVSIVLVLFASALAVLLPVLLSRVVVDGILMDTPNALIPDFGLLALTQWVSKLGGISEVSAACCIYAIFILICHTLYHFHRVKLASVVLFSLRDMRQDLFAHMELRPSSFYDRVAIGRVMTRITNDVQALIELLMGLGALIGQFVPFFIALFVMFAINAELTLYLLGAIPLFVVVTYFFRQATRKVYRLIRNTVSQLNQNLQENLSGMQVVQLSNRENFNLNVYEGINNGNRKHEFHAVNLESTYGAFMDNMVNLALAVIIWVGGGAALQESVSLGSVILFTYFIDMFIQPIRVLGHQYNILFRAMASAERIFQALDWDESVDEPVKPVELRQRTAGEIEFKNLSFSYDDELPVLKDISLKIAAGEKLAVVGPTGSGKSTLIRLLGRFYNFQRGTIFLDGVDLLDLDSKDLRQRIGVVMQDFHIFSGTILDNITLGNPNISDERGIEAARAVNADNFIESLPESYQTELVERGQNLSQGQRQLLAFARVLAADPEILVLDEATASIDTETEEIIQSALKTIMKGRTSILIAHRLKTIQEADRILVLKNGRVKEIGTHDQLMANKDVYYTLSQLQFQDVSI
ncbi:MAG: ABC transporter [Gammaproteobacteria bacterium]|jgi:ATP-binding cassette subfamily B multidrug efflux pump|nr:ABC transporter [Gammaproteobacteria bacterium]|tara:strand:- start:1715 stop:3598 length:1884 start_codon:yes stop_codon:yes gene_type:complete